MNEKLNLWIRGLDSLFYWLFVLVFAVGMLTSELIPPKMDVVAFAGLIFACVVLKPMVLQNK